MACTTACLAMLASVCLAQHATPGWHQDLETAKQEAARSNRPLLVHFWAPWCKPCMRLQKDVLDNPAVTQSIQSHCVPVMLNADQFPAVARQLGVDSLPTDVVLTPAGQVIDRWGSPPTAPDYINKVVQVAAAHAGVQSHVSLAAAAPESDRSRLVGNRYNTPPVADSVTAHQPPIGSVQPTAPSKTATSWHDPAAAPQASLMHPNGSPSHIGAQAMTGLGHPPAFANGSPSHVPVGNGAVAGNAVPAPSHPPLAMEGFCPVTLVEGRFDPTAGKKQSVWVRGDSRWGAIHRGRTYLFAGLPEREQFLANPDRYSPVLSGFDPVLVMDYQQTVTGLRKHGVFYDGMVYLFSSEATLQQFSRSPERYATEVRQAMQRPAGQLGTR